MAAALSSAVRPPSPPAGRGRPFPPYPSAGPDPWRNSGLILLQFGPLLFFSIWSSKSARYSRALLGGAHLVHPRRHGYTLGSAPGLSHPKQCIQMLRMAVHAPGGDTRPIRCRAPPVFRGGCSSAASSASFSTKSPSAMDFEIRTTS